MLFTPNQIEAILGILNNRISFYIGTAVGTDYLSSDQKRQLKSMGFDLEKLYKNHADPLWLQYQLGMMSEVFGKYQTNKISWNTFQDMIRRGEYIKLSPRELYTLDSIKRQSLTDIRSFQGKIFNDVNNIINKAEKNSRQAYEKVIRKEIESGLQKRKSYKEIASDLGHKTGDWARNWDRIVKFQGHLAFDEGRAAIYERIVGEGALVYKDVYPGACKHCIRLYLTAGIGSQPRIFTLEQLKQNGSNIGRKTDEWKAVIGPTHPFCRCTLNKIDEGEEWDEQTKTFKVPKEKVYETKLKRKKVSIFIGEKEYLV